MIYATNHPVGEQQVHIQKFKEGQTKMNLTLKSKNTSPNFIYLGVPGSPQVLRAELGLQELEELVSPCRVLQRLLQGEAPLLHTLLAGVPTAHTGEHENRTFTLVSVFRGEARTSQHLMCCVWTLFSVPR